MYHVRHMYSRIPKRPKMIYNVSMHFGHVPGRLSGRPLQGRAIRKASHWAVAADMARLTLSSVPAQPPETGPPPRDGREADTFQPFPYN